MVNQIGYIENHPKYAIVRTDLNLQGMEYTIVDLTGTTILKANISEDLGSGYGFLHHYELNFTSLTAGTYKIKIGSVYSYPFSVKAEPYSSLVSDALNFLELNQCGKSPYHAAGHLQDGIIYNGPWKGTYVNMTGGWHDAGDYLKFTRTTAETLILLEESLIYGHIAPTERFLNTLRWGLDWIKRTWLPNMSALIYMVGNVTDHSQGFRLPEDDILNPRPVYVCESGKGANIAGAASAALSLAYILHNRGITPELIPDSDALNEAIDLYNFGLHNMGIQQTDMGNGDLAYADDEVHDDMALAAILLYNITNNNTYYNSATNFEETFTQNTNLYFTVSNIFAYLHLHENGYSQDHYYYDMEYYISNGNNDPLHFLYTEYFWGSVPAIINVGIATWMYEKTSGNNHYAKIIDYAVNYAFGINQWGVCFVTGHGEVYPHHLHHQILYIENLQVPGILSEGGVSRQIILDNNIETLNSTADPFAIFQSDKAFYQDYVWNYVGNEPTIRSQGFMIFLFSIL